MSPTTVRASALALADKPFVFDLKLIFERSSFMPTTPKPTMQSMEIKTYTLSSLAQIKMAKSAVVRKNSPPIVGVLFLFW